MVTPTFDISEYGLRGTTTRAPRVAGESLRFRHDVVAGSAVDVVRSAGGWLYDRAMAGWEVTVLLPRVGDSRPPEMNRGMTEVRYVLSAAARVFKRQALTAAGIPCESADSTETMLSDIATWAI